jgi:hypothetical protein
MKRSRLSTLLLSGVLGFVLVLGGCDSLSSYNDNPNAPTEANPNNVLANAQRDLHNVLYDDNGMMRGSNLYAQYTTQNFYTTEESRYGTVDFAWETFYNSLTDLRQAKELSSEVPNGNNLRAVATINQVWAFQILTDYYGDIPFGEALQGSENRSPAYTPQSEIYPALIDSLDSALSTMSGGAGPSGDLVYGGDMNKWRKLANGLKMRIALRMSGRNEDMAETVISNVVNNATTLESNEDNAYFQFSTSSTHRNDYYENRITSGRDDFDVSDRFVEAMQQYGTDDPRLDAYAEQTSGNTSPCPDGSGNYAGFPYGMEQGAAQSLQSSRPSCNASRPELFWPGGPSGDGDAYSPIMYYDEVLFIKAEAAQRGWISGTPEDYLADAIAASIDFYGQETDADISSGDQAAQDYIDAVTDDFSSGDWEQVLGEQKWIALYMNDIQGWSTWRRLDFGDWIGPPTGGVSGDLQGQFVPLRADYPDSEFNLNDDNVTEAIERQFEDGDNPGAQVWWDVEAPDPNEAYDPSQ